MHEKFDKNLLLRKFGQQQLERRYLFIEQCSDRHPQRSSRSSLNIDFSESTMAEESGYSVVIGRLVSAA
jgi:hypothetical protein